MKRLDDDFDNFVTVTVPSVNINLPLGEFDNNNTALWLDCEGMSLPLILAIDKSNLSKIKYIYAEFETYDIFSAKNTMIDLEKYVKNSPFVILAKARTSHNQYNVLLSDQVNLLQMISNRLLNAIFSILHPVFSVIEKINRKLKRMI